MRTLRTRLVLLLLFLASLGAFFVVLRVPTLALVDDEFDGERALDQVAAQMAFGPRVTGSPSSQRAAEYFRTQLEGEGWSVEAQDFSYRDTPIRNLIARANRGQGPVIIVGAHYDSRRRADRDADHPDEPVPGANDGASGAAVLLELGRSLDRRRVPYEVWLAFFDAEDNGNLDGWDWLVGSAYMAQHLRVHPEAMILVDMVGDAQQELYFDQNSDAGLSARLWATAAGLGYAEYFVPMPRWAMIDDHTPFAEQGIPAVDIIDFDYPAWHTTRDTLDQVSAASLERVGRTLEAFLEGRGS